MSDVDESGEFKEDFTPSHYVSRQGQRRIGMNEGNPRLFWSVMAVLVVIALAVVIFIPPPLLPPWLHFT
jgi:hypothetical protein